MSIQFQPSLASVFHQILLHEKPTWSSGGKSNLDLRHLNCNIPIYVILWLRLSSTAASSGVLHIFKGHWSALHGQEETSKTTCLYIQCNLEKVVLRELNSSFYQEIFLTVNAHSCLCSDCLATRLKDKPLYADQDNLISWSVAATDLKIIIKTGKLGTYSIHLLSCRLC